MIESVIEYLKNKYAGVSILEFVQNEFESVIYWLIGSLPGAIGVLVRNLLYLLLFKKLGGVVWIQPRVTIVNSNRLVVGKRCGINSGTYLNCKGGITLGDNVLIGANCTISSGKHLIDGRDKTVIERPVETLPIVFEDDVWIGSNVVIMPGVTLKKGTVVGAGAVVTKDTEEYSVNVGIPAKKIRSR